MLDKHDPSSLNVDSYRAAYCEFDFRFMYITKDMAQIEEFEINYNSHLHMSQNIDVKVDLGDPLGEWVYPVVWNYPLEDMLVTVEGSTYKSLTGSAKVQGHFLTMTGSLPLITDIYSKVYSMYTNELLSQEHITA
jgi:argininosuccinate synthase